MVTISAISLATHALTFYSFGMFVRPVTMEFNWERGAFSAAVSIGMLVSGSLGILAGRLSDKYGPRLLVTTSGLLTGLSFLLMSQISSLWHVYLAYGVLMSFGGSSCVVPVTSTIPRWFTKRRGSAMGLTWTGIGLGGIVAPVLSQWLISDHGWRLAYIILGLINLVVITLLAQFMKRSPQPTEEPLLNESETIENEQLSTSTEREFSFKQAVKTKNFWVFGIIQACFVFTIQIVVAHIAPHAIDIGIPAAIAASIVSIYAGTSLIGRNVSGFVCDKIGGRLTMMACLAILTLTLIWLLFAADIRMLYLFAAVYGISYGGMVPLQTLIAVELFGIKYLGVISASLMLVATFGGAAGPPLAGSIFDVTGRYQLAFMICTILCALAVFLSFILLRSQSKDNRYQ